MIQESSFFSSLVDLEKFLSRGWYNIIKSIQQISYKNNDLSLKEHFPLKEYE